MNSNSYCTSKLLCKATIKWTVWLVHFAERTEGKLATFTVVNLVATAPQTWPCYFLSIVVFTTSHRHSENKKEVTLGNRLVALQEPASANQNFGPIRNSSTRLMAFWEQMISPCSASSPANNIWQSFTVFNWLSVDRLSRGLPDSRLAVIIWPNQFGNICSM